MTPALLSGPEATVLLERSINFARGMVRDISTDHLARPTPCRDWDLRMLMLHLNESLSALREGIDGGAIDLAPPSPVDPGVGLAAAFRYQAGGLLGSCANRNADGLVGIGDRALPTSVVAAIGALEITVHGWDVGHAQGRRPGIPDGLAASLLDVASVIVPTHDRGGLFAASVRLSGPASTGDRLVAFLGRDPSH